MVMLNLIGHLGFALSGFGPDVNVRFSGLLDVMCYQGAMQGWTMPENHSILTSIVRDDALMSHSPGKGFTIAVSATVASLVSFANSCR